MGETYEVNEFNEVVPYLDGRRSTDTRLNRELTGYEEQLREELADLRADAKEMAALLDQYRREHEQYQTEIEALQGELKIAKHAIEMMEAKR